jgi:hypothetical protein
MIYKSQSTDFDKCFGQYRRASLKQPVLMLLSLHTKPTQFHTNTFGCGSEHGDSSLENILLPKEILKFPHELLIYVLHIRVDPLLNFNRIRATPARGFHILSSVLHGTDRIIQICQCSFPSISFPINKLYHH